MRTLNRPLLASSQRGLEACPVECPAVSDYMRTLTTTSYRSASSAHCQMSATSNRMASPRWAACRCAISMRVRDQVDAAKLVAPFREEAGGWPGPAAVLKNLASLIRRHRGQRAFEEARLVKSSNPVRSSCRSLHWSRPSRLIRAYASKCSRS